MKLFYKSTIELERKAVEGFKELYPQRGALKWFVNLCLWKFVEIHDHDLDKEIGETVEAVVKEMREEEGE